MHIQTLDYRDRALDTPHSSAGDLLIDLSVARAEIAASGKAMLDQWGVGAAGAPYAQLENLAHHLAAQRVAGPDLARRLAALGLVDVTRSQAVMPTLDTVIASLERLIGVPASRYPDPEALNAAALARRVARDAIFGAPAGSGPCLVVTLAQEASHDPRLVRDLMVSGMTCARIDSAEGDADAWRETIVNVRIAERDLDRSCRILMHLPGRRSRIIAVAGPEKRRVMKGDTIVLVRRIGDADGRSMAFACEPLDHLRPLALGDRVWINDGRIGAQVVACSDSAAHLEVTSAGLKGEKLKAGKSVRFPGRGSAFPLLSRADKAALDFIAENADAVGCSGLNAPGDVDDLVHQLAMRRRDAAPMPILLGIETPDAFASLPHLLARAAVSHPVSIAIAERAAAIECGAERFAQMRDWARTICWAAATPLICSIGALNNLARDGVSAAPDVAAGESVRSCDALLLEAGPRTLEATQFLRDFRPSASLAATLPVGSPS